MSPPEPAPEPRQRRSQLVFAVLGVVLCLLLGEDRRGDERVCTQAFAGVLADDARLRAEFMHAIAGRGP